MGKRGKSFCDEFDKDFIKTEYGQKLKENEQLLSLVFDQVPFFMMIVDNQLDIIKMNKAGLEAAGKGESNIPGDRFGAIFNCVRAAKSEQGCGYHHKCQECGIRNSMKKTLETGESCTKVESELLVMSGEGFTVHTVLVSTAEILTNGSRNILLTIDDITNRKKMELDFKIAKEMARKAEQLKSSFLANMSHEIRTPLNSIMGYAELLKRKTLSEEKRNKFIDIINTSGKQLVNVVTDIIDISEIETNQVELYPDRIEMDEFLEEIYYYYQRNLKKNIKLIVEKNNSNQFLNIDSARLKQIINHLMDNAIKFTDSGKVTMGYTLKNNNSLEIYIKDTGIGIPKDIQETIFEQFCQADGSYTRKYGGTGLGLTISKKLIELMGGKIRVESEPGRGSIFSFTLPVTNDSNSLKNKIK